MKGRRRSLKTFTEESDKTEGVVFERVIPLEPKKEGKEFNVNMTTTPLSSTTINVFDT